MQSYASLAGTVATALGLALVKDAANSATLAQTSVDLADVVAGGEVALTERLPVPVTVGAGLV